MKVFCACGASIEGDVRADWLWHFLLAHTNARIEPKPGVRYEAPVHAVEIDLWEAS